MRYKWFIAVGIMVLLCCCGRHEDVELDEAGAREIMDDVSRRNKAYEQLTAHDDTLMRQVVAYYDEHGTANERMEAYYLLGSVQRDLHDAPKAMESFLKGVSVADTLDKNCRYEILARLHGQMSELLYKQCLFTLCVREEEKVSEYAAKAGDMHYAISAMWFCLGFQYHSGQYELVVKKTRPLLEKSRQYGEFPLATQQLVVSVLACLKTGRNLDAREFLELYEKYSGEVDTTVHRGRFPFYYNAKGRVLLAENKLDSAAIFFQRELEAADWNNRQAAYRGLRDVYVQMGRTDSALWYARLQCEAVDSDYQAAMAANLQKLREVYDYSRAQEESHIKSLQLEKEQRWRQRLWWGIVIILIGCALVYGYLRELYRKKIVDADLELERANTEQTEMMLLVAELQEKLRLAENEQERVEISEELDRAKNEYGKVKDIAKGFRKQFFPYSAFHIMLQRIKNGEVASPRDYEMILKMLEKSDKSLMGRFMKEAPMASEMERKIFMLRRMGMTKTEISLLTAHAKSSIITAIGRLFEKVHMRKPRCSAEADEWLLKV